MLSEKFEVLQFACLGMDFAAPVSDCGPNNRMKAVPSSFGFPRDIGSTKIRRTPNLDHSLRAQNGPNYRA